MYDVIYDRSKDHILYDIITELILKNHEKAFKVVCEIYTKYHYLESLKGIEKDYQEYIAEFKRLSKLRGGKFKMSEVEKKPAWKCLAKIEGGIFLFKAW